MSDQAFIFLYPQPEIFEFELKNRSLPFVACYKTVLNHTIDKRYRQKGFTISYAILDDCEVSDVIDLQDSDNVLKVGMDAKTHRTEVNGKYPYPDQDHILDQLGEITVLRVAGFHAYDCCEKLAQKAHEKGIDSLVDEELTQFFLIEFEQPDFNPEKYPSVDLREKFHDKELFEHFLSNRKSKPWLWDWEQERQVISQ